jgi:choloylglycine hydrolase
MKKYIIIAAVAVAVCCQILISSSPVAACTGICIKPKDGAVIHARTLEFAFDFSSNVIVIPKNMKFVGTAPGNKPGLSWKTKYGMVGVNAFDKPVIVDGLNEKGLAVGIFYMPGYAKYQEIDAQDVSHTISPWELPLYLLSGCASVKEAVAAAQDIKVGEVIEPNLGFAPPVHFIVHDAGGKCVVLEYVNGELKVHDDPIGVITNSPTFDWHITNLCNYINLTVTNVPPIDISGIKFSGLGQGTGMLGLPGDFTPPSRFIRAVVFSQSALPVETAQEGVLQAFHILNQFDIPKGAARESDHGKVTADYTLWTSASDLKNLRFYFHTFENRQIRMIDLKKMDLNAKDLKTFSMGQKEDIDDLSNAGK